MKLLLSKQRRRDLIKQEAEMDANVNISAGVPGCVPNRAKCYECGKFVSNKELGKVPSSGVPMCDECVSGIDNIIG